jgi:hypothetical protein
MVYHRTNKLHTFAQAADYLVEHQTANTITDLSSLPPSHFLTVLQNMFDSADFPKLAESEKGTKDKDQKDPLRFTCSGCFSGVFVLEIGAVNSLIEKKEFNLDHLAAFVESYWIFNHCLANNILPDLAKSSKKLQRIDFPVLSTFDQSYTANSDHSLGTFTSHLTSFLNSFLILTFIVLR